MNFTRYQCRGPQPVTPGRIAAAARAVRRQLEDCPLFPELVPDHTPQARLARLDAASAARIADWRAHRAAQWRRARRLLRHDLRPTLAAGIRRWWRNTPTPADPSYLLDAIWQASRGRWCPWRSMATARRLALRLPVPTDH